MNQPMPHEASVELRSISKYFGENRVLDDVNVSFAAGEIHAVLGANGSGKSTLIKVLAGYHTPTTGSVLLHGKQVTFPVSQKDLHRAGVRFVHQDLGLFDSLSVAENLALSLGYHGRLAIGWGAVYRASERDLEAAGLGGVDPRVLVSTLGPVQRTLVAIARAIADLPPGTGVLVLDEPTARLPHDQVEVLLDRCRTLRRDGVALVYVSHRLDEVFAMADRVTVLRDGRVALSKGLSETTEAELTSTITGHAAVVQSARPENRAEKKRGEPVVRVRGVSGARVDRVDFDLYAGEILAITGLVGSGRSELGRIIYGAQESAAGEVDYRGRPLRRQSPRRSVAMGIGYVPQDRRQGGFGSFDLAENLSMADLRPYLRRGVLSPSRRRNDAVREIAQLDVQPADPRRLLQELSGGNQQKVILAKWLRLDLSLLILDEPTYGVDVGARQSLMGAIAARAQLGLAVLLLDSDIELVSAYADRVLVMQHGRIVTELVGEHINPEEIATASYAVSRAAKQGARAEW